MKECQCNGVQYPLKESGYWLCIECGVQYPMGEKYEHLRT